MKSFKIFKKKDIEDFQSEKETKKEKSNVIKDLLNSNKITTDKVLKQIPFLLLLFLLAIVYINNRNNYERKIREIAKLKKERNELRAEYIFTSSELMRLSKQSELKKLIDTLKLDLHENTVPPIKLTVKKSDN